MHNGIMIDDYNPRNESIYELVVEYFDNPMLTKFKDIDGYSMYIAKIKSMLSIEFRYIIAFIPIDDVSIGTYIYLKNLKWSSFQCRTLSENYQVQTIDHTPKKQLKFNSKIKLNNRTNNQTTYDCEDYYITITLLHKNNILHEFANSGTLNSALETWRTIITFK